MGETTPRLRMFAGPNGSGKSTIKSVIPAEMRGVYINADDIEKEIKTHKSLNLAPFSISPTAQDFVDFYRSSSLLASTRVESWTEALQVKDNIVRFPEGFSGSYLASVTSDFIRRQLLDLRLTFTFETVMSHKSKIEILREAQSLGYRTYLYFIATADPEINVSRVRARVSVGGHGVPENKIKERYWRSMENLFDAILNSNRAYIWDNSGGQNDLMYVAKSVDGQIEIMDDHIPLWFQTYVLDKIETG